LFYKLVERLKHNYPGPHKNYVLAQIRGQASTNHSGPLVERLKHNYPGPHGNSYKNYVLAQIRGQASTNHSGPITMEIKLAITLRMLAGASYLDMIWYGVQISLVHKIFEFVLCLLDNTLSNDEIFNFNPEKKHDFLDELKKLAGEWSSINLETRGCDLMKGTILAGDGVVIPIAVKTAASKATVVSRCLSLQPQFLSVNRKKNKQGIQSP